MEGDKNENNSPSEGKCVEYLKIVVSSYNEKIKSVPSETMLKVIFTSLTKEVKQWKHMGQERGLDLRLFSTCLGSYLFNEFYQMSVAVVQQSPSLSTPPTSTHSLPPWEPLVTS